MFKIYLIKNLGFISILVVFFFIQQLEAQITTCDNIGFENGNLNGWKGETGSCCPINTAALGIINGRHTLMSGNGTDPNTNNMVTVVAPGSTYSARLGNESVGAEAERMSYTLTVDPYSTLFIYKYAVVLEDPNHPASDQPRFQLRVLDVNNQLVDPVCGQYTVVAAASIPGFVSYGSVRYKDWTTVGMDLTPYLGQTITLEFSTGDCAQGGHFGYAYVDAACGSLEITSNFCSGATTATLIAPEGFEYLWSTGDTTQSIVINNPVEGDLLTCTLTSVTGCQVEVSTILKHLDPIADFEVTSNCFNNVQFSDISFIPPNVTINSYQWDFGDGNQYVGTNPNHTYAAAGDYTVSLKIDNNDGCFSTVNKVITTYAPPTANLSYGALAYCESDNPQSPILIGTSEYQNGVYSSTNGLAIDSGTGIINPNASQAGNYVVSYQIPAFHDCPPSEITTNITITALPTAVIDYGVLGFCEDDSAIATPTLTGTGIYLGGMYTADSGLSINPVTGAVNPALSAPGNYQIYYTTVPFGGCLEQVFSTDITIYQLPQFNLDDGFICVDKDRNVIQNYLIQAPFSNSTHSFKWYYNGNEIPGEITNSLVVDKVGVYAAKAADKNTLCTSLLGQCSVVAVAPFNDFAMAFIGEGTYGPNLEIKAPAPTGFLYQLDNEEIQLQNVFNDIEAGVHTVTVYDERLCHSITKNVIVVAYPNYFTPNGDGYNDFWNLKNIKNLTGIKVSIFDRFGKLISVIRADEAGWDGNLHGNKLPSDDYWFSIDYGGLLDPQNTIVWKEFRGHFALKR